MIRIGLDGMGGDYAPQVVVEGAVLAANDFPDLEIVLVGQTEVLKRELNKHKVLGGKIVIEEAPEVVGMGESPVAALKKKRNSSIGVGVDLHKQGKIQAFVSAGNTGAMVAASTLTLGNLKGVKRPGIAIGFPTLRGISVVMDVGANLNPSAEELYQYAVMSENYARFIFKKKRPSIALLNIGEEESKGTEALKEAYKILRDSPLNFVGNIEGRDFFTGKVDCIVCDGFVGNVVLKMLESILETAVDLVKRELSKNPISLLGAWLCKPALSSIRQTTNYEEAGGAPLLGVNGNIIISHGISSAKAIRNALRVAGDMVVNRVNDAIVEGLVANLNHREPQAAQSQDKR